ncbi:MAG TPA: alpha/beta hydrolase [Mycobacteriales bacterium]
MTSRYRLAVAAPEPYGGFRSGWTTVGGRRLHARTCDDAAGIRVVLVHGLAVSHRYLMPTAALLARRHPVAALDLPGFGLSDEPGRVLDTRELADALGGWLAATGDEPVVLVGNSYGCQVIADLVARRPAVAAAVVLAGPTVDPAARSATRQVLRWLSDAIREPPAQGPILVRDTRDAGVRRVLTTLRHSVRDRIEDKLPRIPVPALVVRGGIEPIVPARWAAQAAALLPRGELAVLPGSPHNSVYAAPGPLTDAVEGFLTRVG